MRYTLAIENGAFMCTNGVNTNQLQMMIEQMDDQVALNRRWVHKIYHQASDVDYTNTAEVLKKAQELLDETRALLTDAQDALEKDVALNSGVTVNLV